MVFFAKIGLFIGREIPIFRTTFGELYKRFKKQPSQRHKNCQGTKKQ